MIKRSAYNRVTKLGMFTRKTAMSMIVATLCLFCPISVYSEEVELGRGSIGSSNSEESFVSNLNKISNGHFDRDYCSNKINWQYKSGGYSKTITNNGETYGTILAGTLDEHILQKIPTVVGKTYTLEAAVRIESEEISGGMYVTTKEVINNGQGPVLKQVEVAGKKNGWSQVHFSFTATTPETFVGLVKWVPQFSKENVAISASMDNVVVTEENEYQLIWEDDFSGDNLNQNNWGYELGSVRGNEQQHYTDSPDNVYVQDGNLVLRVTDRKEEDRYLNPRGKNNARQVIYDSGSIRTVGKQEFLYGRIEARVKLPKGKGAFPAFWTLGSDFILDGDITSHQGYGWPSTGELDIFELIGAPTGEHTDEKAEGTQSNKMIYGTPHFYYVNGDVDKDGSYSPVALGGNLSLVDDFSDKYHIFGMNWYPDRIEWYVDGVVYNTMYLKGNERLEAAASCFNKPQYIQFNLATGGNWARNAGNYLAKDSTELLVDYVRYYQDAEQKAASEAYYHTAPSLSGVRNITMREGESPDLTNGVTTSTSNYDVDFSIENEYMFSNIGGNTNVDLQVSGKNDLEALSNLAPGLYNIYYSAVPKDSRLGADVTPEAKIARKVALLTVLPKEGLVGERGGDLSTVALPSNLQWVDPTQKIDREPDYVYRYITLNGRQVLATIAGKYISINK
ncbi:glycoside hydrolase family 16 protein [Streptococcus sp. ZJ93]|uniref:glycoside hydrolase family 16 protein n=1 Tax=Streptococcus handemini TaxID=3161188 RepID=UPI0032ED275E